MKKVVIGLVCIVLILCITLYQLGAVAVTQTKPPFAEKPSLPADWFVTATPSPQITKFPYVPKPSKFIPGDFVTATPSPQITKFPYAPKPSKFIPGDFLTTPTVTPEVTPKPNKPHNTNPPTATLKPSAGQNICSMGLYFREMRPALTDDWFFFTPIELNHDGIQIYPLIASNTYEVGELKLTIENGQLLAEYWLLDGIEIVDEFLTFFPNLDSVKTVNVQMLGGQEYPFNEQIDIAKTFGEDTKVILYMNNSVHYNNTVPGLKFFDLESYRPWMWEVMNLLD